jgi:tetratricopeptide (TPR) repeat protein
MDRSVSKQSFLLAASAVISQETSATRVRTVPVSCGVIIALVSCANLFAQTSADRGWAEDRHLPAEMSVGGPWYPSINEENAVFDWPSVSTSRTALFPTVTLHELRHRIPARAQREFERALKAVEKGQKEDAIRCFKRAILADPEFQAAINNLGVLYIRSNSLELAVEQFTKAISIDPHAAPPYLNLAVVYLRQGQYVEAERVARRAVDLARGDPNPLLVLGVSLVLEQRFTRETEGILIKAAASRPVAALWLALGLLQRGDLAAAREHLKRYISQNESVGAVLAADLIRKIQSSEQDK